MLGSECLKWVSDDCQKSDASFVGHLVRHLQTLVYFCQIKQRLGRLTLLSESV